MSKPNASRTAPWRGLLAAGVMLGLLLGAANQAAALKCVQTKFAEQVTGAAAVVFGEVVSVKGRTGMIKVDAVLKGKELLKGVETLRLHRHSRYIYVPPKGTLLLLYLSKSEIGKPDAKKTAEVVKPAPCNLLTVLRKAK